MLFKVYNRLLAHFGQPHNWWPIFGDDPPFEMLLGAVLVQQTRWETVEEAILRLRDADLLAPRALAVADPVALAALLRPVAFHTQKAPGIIAISRYLVEHYDGSLTRMLDQPTAPLRRELLALPRIGPETADVILLYIGGHPVFVVDEYTRRMFGRITTVDRRPQTEDAESQISDDGADQPIFDWHRARYDAVQRRIEATLEREMVPNDQQPSVLSSQFSVLGSQPSVVQLYADYHALINEECVRYCLARPRCDGPPARRVYSRQADRESYLGRNDGCPLRAVCGWYASLIPPQTAAG